MIDSLMKCYEELPWELTDSIYNTYPNIKCFLPVFGTISYFPISVFAPSSPVGTFSPEKH